MIFARWMFASVLALTLFQVPAVAQRAAIDLPGREQAERVAAVVAQLRRSGNVSDVRWMDDQRAFCTVQGKRMQIDLATFEMTPATDEPPVEQVEQPVTRRPARVPRAQQRTVEISPDGKWRAVYRRFNVVLEPIEDTNDNDAAPASEPESAPPAGSSETPPGGPWFVPQTAHATYLPLQAQHAAAAAGDPSEQHATLEPIQVTTDGTELFRYGTGNWVYGEELGQNTAMWWSPDSRKLAFYEVDERHMRNYYLTTANTAMYTRLHVERYPKAGDANPRMGILVYDLEEGTTTRVLIEGPLDQYLYNIRYSPDGNELLMFRLNRWQNELDLIAADVTTGQSRVVLTETQETWQYHNPMLRFLADGRRFVWETERTGWKQFELRQLDGTLVNLITPEMPYPCESIAQLDEQSGWVYFTANSAENPMNQQLHRVQLSGEKHQRLTPQEHNHTWFSISPDDRFLMARYEAIDVPPVTVLYDLQDGRELEIARPDTSAAAQAGLTPSELFSFTASDGETPIYGVLYKPTNFDPQRQYPLLIDVYGGPLSRGFGNRYDPANPSCEYGFIIAKIANRGTLGRGKAFEAAVYLRLGDVDLQDQADGVKFLTERPYIDAHRVGIYGHSYGGYMSALAVLKFPDLFHVAVAGAPVTDWRHYDTIYTERYMRLPKENADGYDQGSCMTFAGNLTGRLLLVHGLVDDNVHPANTWQLVDTLQRANKRFDLMIYPNAAHGIGGNYGAIRWEYLVEHLQAQPHQVEQASQAEQGAD